MLSTDVDLSHDLQHSLIEERQMYYNNEVLSQYGTHTFKSPNSLTHSSINFFEYGPYERSPGRIRRISADGAGVSTGKSDKSSLSP